MTLRARPVARRRGRAGWDSGDRRNSLINLGFILAIGLSVLILIGYAAWSWYDDHFGAAATVNGTVITKDDLRARLKVETFRLDYVESRIQYEMARGRISPEDGQQQIQFINQRKEQVVNLALERLVDITLMGTLAQDNGITVSEEDIDAKIVEEATTAEQRHVWLIQIEPATDPDTGEPTDEQKRAALVKAQQALGELTRGASWEDVARKYSDAANAPQAGDLGWLQKDSGYDEAFMDAVFAAELNEPTDIVEADDGTYMIGRYTEVAPEEVDEDFETAIAEANITMEEYRLAVRGDVTREKLSDKIVADLSKPGPQRHVLQLRVPERNESSLGEGEPGAKVRWIAYAPNDDMGAAENLEPDDPAWAKAEAEADAAYAILKDDPDRFDELAREQSDEASGKRNGGKQPWYYDSSQIDAALRVAIVDIANAPGTVLEPIKGDDAWFVIQIMRRTDVSEDDFMSRIKAEAVSEEAFRRLVRDHGEGEGADKGGDIGWITRGQLAEELDEAIFAAPVGSVSEVVDVAGDARYLFWILAEETRELTEEQLDIIEQSGFSYWYSKEKAKADIDYALGS
ncbi:MAG TPA: peptidylprolyl isomerase [Candidatus Binatia bacterium]|nr:peptidylprolyl isomerase [Candidatus Binatia bacterium]